MNKFRRKFIEDTKKKTITNYSNNTSSGGTKTNTTNTSSGGASKAYDTNTDYQAKINEAVSQGDMLAAAQYEQLRNQKIADTGSNYSPTSKYAGYLDNTDYGTVGLDQIARNASPLEVYETAVNRYNKASNTVGLEQYANDEIQQKLLDYINNNQARMWHDNYMENNRQPEYESKYNPQIDVLLNQILNRDDFSYDVASDPLYQQYAKMYQREGDRAMKETMAEAAAGAGGMNSYAITAAQQAANNYSAQLNDRIPELYQLAYDMYLGDKESQIQNLGILQNADATQYARYRDTMDDFRNDRNFLYGLYQDDLAQRNWQKNFDYNDSWANKEWDYNTGRDAISDSRYDQETAKEEVWKLISLGVTPSADLIAKSGMSQADINLAVAAVQAENTKSRSSGGSGGSDGGTDYIDDIDDDVDDTSWMDALKDLGISYVNDPGLLAKLYDKKAIYVTDDGKYHWAEGWNSQNFRSSIYRG